MHILAKRPRRSAIVIILSVFLLNSTSAYATFPGGNGMINAMQIVPATDTACPADLSYAGQILLDNNLTNPDELVLSDDPDYVIQNKLTWSPDGNQFAFETGDNQIYGVANADGSSIEGPGGGYGFMTSTNVDSVSWLPDGITLAIGNIGGAWVTTLGSPDVTFVREGENGAFSDLDFGFDDIVWSPTWSHFAYNKNYLYGDPMPFRVGVSDADGTNQHIFTESSQDPDWSPDGTKLVFTSDRSGLSTNPQQIYTMNYDGTGLNQLTNNNTYRYHYPVWSPDGTKILVAREVATTGYDQPMTLMTLDAQTGSAIDTYSPPCTQTYFHSLGWQPLGLSKVYRMANWKTHERLFTTNKTEALFVPDDTNGWVLEGTAFTIQDSTDPNAIPVYRLANWKTKERLFTTSSYERDYAITHHEGWVSEGTAFYATSMSGSDLMPVYRMANWKTHERLFTTDANERDYAVAHYDGWVSEGTAFYVPNS